jgi:hypothetical protein
MNNVIYRHCIADMHEVHNEESVILFVTQENNGFGVFRSDYNGYDLLKWFKRRDEAIEWAVENRSRLREQLLNDILGEDA